MFDVFVTLVLIGVAAILVMLPLVFMVNLHKKYKEEEEEVWRSRFSHGFYENISQGELGPGSVVVFMFKGCDVIAWVNGDGDTTTMIDYRLYGDLQYQEGKQISFPMFRLSDFAEISEVSEDTSKSQHESSA